MDKTRLSSNHIADWKGVDSSACGAAIATHGQSVPYDEVCGAAAKESCASEDEPFTSRERTT